jgi:hypothetical protein
MVTPVTPENNGIPDWAQQERRADCALCYNNPMREWEPRNAPTINARAEGTIQCHEPAPLPTLPREIREVFEQHGYGCLAAETNIGVVHVCHAANSNIEGGACKTSGTEIRRPRFRTRTSI